MRKLILAAGVAAFAIVAPAAAKPDKGGGGHGRHAQAQQGGGDGRKAQRGGGGGNRQAQRMEHRGGGERKAQRMERRGGERKAQRMERRGGGERQAQRMEHRGGGNERRFANFQSDRNERRAQQRMERGGKERHVKRSEQRQAQRFEKRNRDQVRFEDRGRDKDRFRDRGIEQRFAGQDRDFRRDGRVRDFARVNQESIVRFREDYRRQAQWRDWDDDDWDRRFGDRGIPASFVGCPPGLAKKSPACIPPGQARKAFLGTVLPSYYASNALPLGLRDIYYDTDDYYYRYGDGYVYRVDRGDNLISALLPLIGAGYGVGQYFPYYNEPSYYVPSYYQSFYPDSPYDYYRYDDGYVYRIDAGSGYIEDVIPLLDHGYGIGQMMPAGYSYYNVPYQYRDYYPDTSDYYYRYAPGAIYQVDRDSQLITAIASLLTGGLSVGQPLPPAYSVYNVPIDYRDRYYDRPDAWYRYSDGYIYQVDPTTQLITAMVQALV